MSSCRYHPSVCLVVLRKTTWKVSSRCPKNRSILLLRVRRDFLLKLLKLPRYLSGKAGNLQGAGCARATPSFVAGILTLIQRHQVLYAA